jgi:hypothetical protein
LEEQGFLVLGRVAAKSAASAANHQFDRAERARLNAWRARPAFTLLATPDCSAHRLTRTATLRSCAVIRRVERDDLRDRLSEDEAACVPDDEAAEFVSIRPPDR